MSQSGAILHKDKDRTISKSSPAFAPAILVAIFDRSFDRSFTTTRAILDAYRTAVRV
jgi:hypothetical protein